jgi:Tol biopolymer transport system component
MLMAGEYVVEHTSAVANITRITSRPEPEFAPSGCPATGEVAFSGMVWKERGKKDHYEVWVVDPGKSQHQYRRITDSEADSLWPALSPDGKKIVFACQRGEKSQIWETGANGLGGNRLVSDAGDELTYSYPDVTTDAFVFCALTKQYFCGPVEIDDVGRACLTTILAPPLAVYFTGQFLVVNVAMGKPLYQTSILEGKNDRYGYLWLCDYDGLNQTEFVEGYTPRWMPKTAGAKGDKILFSKRDADGLWHIWIVNRDGSNLTQLTWGKSSDIQPAWSPDGSKIAFATNRSSSGLDKMLGDRCYNIWVMNADGTGMTQLTQSKKFCGHPAFMSNEDIYFHANSGFLNENWDIWRLTLTK